MGPVGDGLITLMDQKFSNLDDRLDKLSSKMINTKIETPKPKEPEIKQETQNHLKNQQELKKSKESKPIIIPPTKPRQSFELSTLTNISRKEPKFPLFETGELKSANYKTNATAKENSNRSQTKTRDCSRDI